MLKGRFMRVMTVLAIVVVMLCDAQQHHVLNVRERLLRHDRSVLNRPVPTDSSSFTLLGAWKWGNSEAVTVRDTLLYMGNGSLLQIYSVADTTAPRLLSEVDLFYAINNAIVVKDSIAYVASYNVLAVNVHNPRSPRLVAELDLYATPTRIAVVDSFLYVVTFSGTFWVVDISDPQALVRRGGCLTAGEQAYAIAAKQRGRFAYGGTVEIPPVLSIFDARDPDAPIRRDYPLWTGASSALVRDTLLFVAGGDALSQGQAVIVYSIAIDSLPRRLAHVNTPLRSLPALAVNDTILFVGEGDSVKAMSVKDPSNPRMLCAARNSRPNILITGGMAANEQGAYIACWRGVWSLAPPVGNALDERWFFPTGDVGLRIALKDSLTFYACDNAGLWILNTSNPQAIRPVSNVVSTGETEDVVTIDQYACLVQCTSDTTRGIRIYDVSDPSQPVLASRFIGVDDYPPPIAGAPTKLAYANSILAVTKPDRHDTILVELVDVSNPLNPHSAGIVYGRGDAYGILLQDTLLIVATAPGWADTTTGLYIFSIANTSRPVQLSILPGSYFGVEGHGSYLYATNHYGFRVIDISNPSDPQVVGILDSIGSPSMTYSNGFVYGGGLFAIDVHVATDPRLSATYPLPGSAADHLMRGDTVYVAMNSAGVRILRHHVMTGFAVDQPATVPRKLYLSLNYPNPFNGQTTVEFELPADQLLTLKVYDILGREVKTVFEGKAEMGRHRISIDSAALSSGVYFYQLVTESGERVSQRMVLIK